MEAFTWEVVTHQPLDYLEEVGGATLRYIAPESFRGYGGGYSWHDLVHHQVLFNSTYNPLGLRDARPHYTDAKRFRVNRNLISVLRTYESGTRIQGPVFVLLALLSFAAPFLTTGRARSAAILFGISAWVMLVVPVATVEFSARTAAPALGPFVAAAAIGAQGAPDGVRAPPAARARAHVAGSAGRGLGLSTRRRSPAPSRPRTGAPRPRPW